MSKILFATSNEHKLKEARAILPEIKLLSLVEFPQAQQLNPQEIGGTFEENAKIKALAYGQASQVLTLAEDAGLEVMALDNEPGVRSNRWLGGTNEDHYREVLRRLKGKMDRRARFVAVICLHDPQTGQAHCFEGEIKGTIARSPRGSSGFGYDPIFIPEGHDQTFGELDPTVKHQLSHRRRALGAFYDWWRANQPTP
ncbi:MAG TPA: RdgB/HAM1 family non-canonical purine NTP pyrophosphatase [Patescibacteria group bacterium]|jgi:XTP/dITP diphosphohydrolase